MRSLFHPKDSHLGENVKTGRKPFRENLGNVLFIALCAPFALLFGSALLGIRSWTFPGFGTWFMASLTACGVIAFTSSFIEGIRDGKMPWVWLLIVAGATVLWGSIFWKALWGE